MAFGSRNDPRQEVPRRRSGSLPKNMIPVMTAELLIEPISISQRRYELITETQRYGRIFL